MRILLGKSIMKRLALFFLMSQTVASAQESRKPEEADPRTTTRVTLGSATGTPGTPVVIPIYFTPAAGVDVGRLKLDVHFVSASLKFVKIERGITAELGNVDLRAEVRGEKNEKGVETSALAIVASFLSPGPPPKGIPAGILGYLALKIDEGGRPASISLRATAEAAELKTKKPVENLRASDGKVDVLAPGTQPLLACFFFSH